MYIERGFHTLEIKPNSKRPLNHDWTNLPPSETEGYGIGILAKQTCGIDVDCMDRGISDLFRDIIPLLLLGDNIHFRVGLAPKFLIPCNNISNVSKKRVLVINNTNKIEILGDGQQFVAEGVHPDTNKHYTWSDGWYLVQHKDLPKLTPAAVAQLDKIIAIVAKLSIVDAGDYDVWYKTLMALGYEYGDTNFDEIGLRIAKWWSNTSVKGDDGLTEKQWGRSKNKSIDNPITIKSIVSSRSESTQVDVLDEYVDRYVLMADKTVFDLKEVGAEPKTWDSFKLFTCRHLWVEYDEKGKPKYTQMCNKWAMHPDRKYAERLNWRPSHPIMFVSDGLTYVNSFRFPAHNLPDVVELSKVQPMIDHIYNLFDDRSDGDIMLMWLAHLIQHPDKRPSVHPFLCNNNMGTGRGTLVKLINRLVGSWNCTEVDIGEIAKDDKFNAYLYNTLLCSISEVKGGHKYDLEEILKNKLSSDGDTHVIQLKNKTPFNAFVCTRVFLQSNHKDAIPFGSGDRRYNLFYSNTPKMTPKQARLTHACINDSDAVSHMFAYLSQLDISAYNPNFVMVTKAKAELQDLKKTELHTHVEDYIDTVVMDIGYFKRGSLLDYISANYGNCNTKPIVYILKELGYEGKRMRDSSGQSRYYVSQLYLEKHGCRIIDTNSINL